MVWRRDRLALYLLLTVPFAGILFKTAWMGDDAYITLRTVNHLIDGYGPVWNVGERVQAYTHPLWMLLLASVISVTGDYFYTPILLSVILSITTFVVLIRFIPSSVFGAVIGGVILVLSKAFTDYSTSGLENPLVHFLLAIFFSIYFTFDAKAQGRPIALFWLALLASLGGVARLDSLLLFGPPLLYALWCARRTGLRAIAALMAGAIPLLLWTLFSTFYYGFPFPNTAYAKLNTGLPIAEILMQGLLYLADTAGRDLLTMVVIVIGIIAPLLTRRRTEMAVSIAVLLYLLYIVRIGGDFMVGRFLSAPLLCATVVIMRYPFGELGRWWIGLLLAALLALGLANPKQSPLLSSVDYNVPYIDSNGIADERGHYYQTHGLLSASRLNRLQEQGRVRGVSEPHNFIHCGIGMRGFMASPYTHIIDECGLADPLLARLPAAHDPAWRIGHPLRGIPSGYVGTVRTGENRLVDPQLAEFYDQIHLITQEPLFAPARLAAIWRMNLGRFDHTIEDTRYRYPDAIQLNQDTLAAYFDDLPDNDGVPFETSGMLIDLPVFSHATLIDLGIDLDLFSLIFGTDNGEVGRLTIGQEPLQLGEEQFTIVQVPEAITERGYASVRIVPLRAGAFHLRHFDLVDDDEIGDLALLLRIYHANYYWGDAANRGQRLDELIAQLAALDPADWASIPHATIIDLRRMPTSPLHSLMDERLAYTMLSTDDGTPQLRYHGFTTRPTDIEDDHQGIRLQLAFEALAPFEEPYTVWFHIADESDDDQFMIYDYAPMRSTLTWSPGEVIIFEPTLTVSPGRYEVSTGFWTPGERRRLYSDDGDTYWLNLGLLTAADASVDE